MFDKEFINGDLEVSEFYQLQSAMWTKKNQELWGLSAHLKGDLVSPFIVNQVLDYDLNTYWLQGTCQLKEHLLKSPKFYGRELMINDSWLLTYNKENRCVVLSATFLLDNENEKMTLAKAKKIINEINALEDLQRKKVVFSKKYKDYTLSSCKIAYLPFVTALGYILKNSEYVLRIQASRNDYLIKKIKGTVQYKNWKFIDNKFISTKTGKEIDSPIKTINKIQVPLLEAAANEPLTAESLPKALTNLPEYNKDSVLYFDFKWFDEITHHVLNSKTTINIRKYKVINYAREINAPKKRYGKRNDKLRDLCANLVRCETKLKALEIGRNVIYAPKGDYSPAFSFVDSEFLFDAFKVTTNGLAGRNRVLLDHFYVEDNTIKMMWKGKEYNHYQIALGHGPKVIYNKNTPSLSCLSLARYNYLNDAKRIMFCSKLRGQAVAVKGEIDDLTHEVPARVIFADWEGYSFGDSFVISYSFAKKLERWDRVRFPAPRELLNELSVGDELTIDDLIACNGKNRFSAFHDITVTEVTNTDFEIKARVPMGVGDKITNMHGSKGIVSIILPDEEMPILKNDLSPNMPAGSVDVIIPGVSIYRRKAMGQLFESITRGLGLPEMQLEDLKKKYGDLIKEYDKNSKFSFKGETFNAPCGINHFIRLNHDACSKQSFSYIKSNYNYNLNIAEMELLNLASRGCYNILNELDQRSLSKHRNWYHKIKRLQQDGFIKQERLNLTELQSYFKALGWELNVGDALTKEEISTQWYELLDLVSNKEIDIFE